MSDQHSIRRSRTLGAVLIVMAASSVVFGFYDIFYAKRVAAQELSRKHILEVEGYLDQIGARFEHDSGLSIAERMEILKHEHMLTADQLGRIEVMDNEYQVQHGLIFQDYKPLVVIIVGIATGFALLFLRA